MRVTKQIAAGIILHQDLQHIFIARRFPKADQGALWEFPGGKIEQGETAEQCVIRELNEEIGIKATRIEHFMQLSHDYGDKILDFNFFLIWQYQGKPHGKEQQPTGWVHIDELANYPFPDANVPVINALTQYLAVFRPQFVG